MGVGQTGPGLWQEFYFFPKTTAAALHPGAGRAVVRYALLFFFFFLRVGFGQFADIHRRIPEGDARFWLLPGLFSPAPCGRAKDSPVIWPRSLTYNSKKAQNPQRRQGALSATSAGQIHCVLGSWGAGGPGPAPGPAVSGLRRGGLLSTRCLEPHCRLDRELGKMANGNKTSCAQGRSLGTTSPSGWTQETAAPTAPWP